jgi:hypothetical protein
MQLLISLCLDAMSQQCRQQELSCADVNVVQS